MLTADTITDAQIRELRVRRLTLDDVKPREPAALALAQRSLDQLCDDALDADGMRDDVIEHKARARCAEILNARAKAVR